MRRVSKRLAVVLLITMGVVVEVQPASAQDKDQCLKPVYLTFDTGHMEIAPLVADVLKRQQIRVTFFAANERSRAGDGSLGDYWAPWWRARAQEGHEFASHTLDHVYWRADVKGETTRFLVRPTAGSRQGQEMTWTSAQYCEEIKAASNRLQEVTGQPSLPLFRAPGGKTSPALLAAAKGCGYLHVAWSAAGFLGDELPSERFSNAMLLQKALRDIRAGDVLMAHLGIWSRKEAWAPENLEPLVEGLKARGFCFRTLREHPQFKDWVAGQGR